MMPTLLRSASKAPDFVAFGVFQSSRQMPSCTCSRFIRSIISLDAAGLTTSPRSSLSMIVTISRGLVRPRPKRTFSSFLPSSLSPPPPTLRMRRVSVRPSDCMRALTASAPPSASITRLVAVLSLITIISVTASRKVRCKPSENSCRMPEPETFFSFVSTSSSVHFARPSATRAKASIMTATLMVLAVRTRPSPPKEYSAPVSRFLA